jgi:signal transduction histidine kinase
MINRPAPNPDYDATIRSWERKTPWYRRVSARTGIQGKLVLTFTFLLVTAMTASSWLYVSDSRRVLHRVMGEQASGVSRTLAMASETALGRHDTAELTRVSRDLLKNRDVVAVAFYGPRGDVLTVACQNPDLDWGGSGLLANPRSEPELLNRVRQLHLPALGTCVEVTSPVLRLRHAGRAAAEPDAEGVGVVGEVGVTAPAPVVKPVAAGPGADEAVASRDDRPHLLGYVKVTLSLADHEARLRHLSLTLVLIGAVSVLCSLPLVYVLIHRIFHPIRALVAATHRIAGGDLAAEVAIHRPDMIGTLARSFNQMVGRVRSQQRDLESANTQLAEANRDLERKVQQRTAQLEAANKRLRSEIAEKEDFLRAVSHDLNAPLRNIAGMTTMLLMRNREKFDEDVIHRLERIQKNVEVETDLIAELLELSRIKTRRQKMEPVDVEQMIRELGDLFEDDLRSRRITLSVDTPLPVLHCERARIRQVFQNLVDNAVKYMGDAEGSGFGVHGSGKTEETSGTLNSAPNSSILNPEPRTPNPPREIHVGCVVREDEAEFYVRDTGIGIEPEDLDKVFFVFRRGKSPAVQSVSGKGVGLASVKSIVETYSGTIWVESELGRGSTFRFTLNGKYVQSPDAPPASGAAAVAVAVTAAA